MKVYLSRYASALLFTALAAAAVPYAGPAAQTAAPPKKGEITPAQIETVKELENQIFDTRRTIESYYKALVARNFLDKEGRFNVPLNAQLRRYYGRRTRNVFNEVARTRWKDGRLAELVLVQRVARYGYDRVIIKKWYGELVGREEKKTGADGKEEVNFIFEGIGMNLVVGRKTRSLFWEYVNFRFFTGKDARKVERNIEPPKDAGGPKMRIHPVQKVNQRIAMLREYRRFLILLQRRVDWLVRSVKDRDSSDLDVILKDR